MKSVLAYFLFWFFGGGVFPAVDVLGPVANKEIRVEVQTSRAIHLPFVAVCAGKVLIALGWVRVKSVLA